MKKYYLFTAAIAAMALASCTNDEFVGDLSPNELTQENTGEIKFGLGFENVTRADIYGGSAAKLLGNAFYVTGTKGTELATSPTTSLVFDNYLVQYAANTAGQTESNTANWEYVGLNPGTAPAGYPKLSSIQGVQTIKYWDFSTDQYDFFAFSTGNKTPVNMGVDETPTLSSGQVGVTKMVYGASLANNQTAYTFTIPSEEALKEVYITDITEVLKTNYGKEVMLRFKNLGSKIRLAFYETIPGYSVSEVKFYTVDAADVPTDLAKTTSGHKVDAATLISTATLPTGGAIKVSFPHVGNNNSSTGSESKTDYNMASIEVNPSTTTATVNSHGYGELTENYGTAENAEPSDGKYLGRSLDKATFAGSAAADYYTTVFPVSSSYALTLRVDYKLTSTDGSNEVINIYGAKASIPADLTKWLPNYAYTYIFKISDATNGWTTTSATTDNQGLYPITFDAVVAEATDANAEQTTVTTVSTPSITTYQQGHNNSTNEYSKTNTNDIYVQVMNTAVSPATLVTGLTESNSLVYELSEDVTEAKVLDALVMRTTAVSENNVTGRNGIVLTKKSVIDNTVTTIVNGVDDNTITSVASGTAGKISISSLTANKSYAYVYIPKSSDEEIEQFEPVTVTENQPISGVSTDKFYKLETTTIKSDGTVLSEAEAPNKDYVYFSATENGTGTTTYSYISPIGKTSIPKGCIKVNKSFLNTVVIGDQNAVSGSFYFAKYITNNGKYAVKVIKIV